MDDDIRAKINKEALRVMEEWNTGNNVSAQDIIIASTIFKHIDFCKSVDELKEAVIRDITEVCSELLTEMVERGVGFGNENKPHDFVRNFKDQK